MVKKNKHENIRIASVFNAIQGEGRCAGENVTFIRLFTDVCFPEFFERTRCKFCDTVYNTKLYKDSIRFDDLLRKQIDGDVDIQLTKHVVITGGEPFSLNMKELYDFIIDLKNTFGVKKIDFETNGSFLNNKNINKLSWRWFNKVVDETNIITVSPKLSNSVRENRNGEKFVADYDYDFISASVKEWNRDKFDFKFVINNLVDEVMEVEDFVMKSDIHNDAVFLMCQTPLVNENFKKDVAEYCITRGWNYSPRIHIDIWGQNTTKEK